MNRHAQCRLTGLLLALLLVGRPTLAERPAHWTTITSHQRNFIVTDMPRNDALDLAIWSESVKDRLEHWVGRPLPSRRTRPLIISADQRPDPQGFAATGQAFSDDGHLHQELVLVNPSRMDQEDALEALTGLLLNRWIVARRPTAGRTGTPPRFPAWFQAGVAQNLYPELRDRNLRLLRAETAANQTWRPEQAFDLTVLPPGRWPEKALASLVTAWLADEATPGDLLDAVIAATEAPDGHFGLAAAQRLLRVDQPRTLAMRWDLWLARQDRRLVPGRYSDDTTRLLHLLEMHPHDIGLIHPGPLPGGRLTIQHFIDARDEAWAQRAAMTLAIRLEQESIGKTPELVRAVQPLAATLRRIAGEDDGTSRRRKPSAGALQKQWREAMSGFEQHTQTVQARQAIMDATLRDAPPRPIPGETSNALGTLLDQWEKLTPPQ